MKNSQDPLASLFVNDAEATNREQLATLVRPFLSIDQESREFSFLPEFSEINSNTTKVEVILAGAKARALFLSESDGLFPAEIIFLQIMPEGSVKTALRKLFEDRKVKKDKEGRYFIPGYRISELIKQFNS